MARSANATKRKIIPTGGSLSKRRAKREWMLRRRARAAYRVTFMIDPPEAVMIESIQAITKEPKTALFRRLVREEAARVLLGQVRKALPELSQPEEPDSGG